MKVGVDTRQCEQQREQAEGLGGAAVWLAGCGVAGCALVLFLNAGCHKWRTGNLHHVA
jgi:hypothetical protein